MAYSGALDAYKDFGRKSGNLLMGLGQYFGSKGGPKVNEQFATAKPVGADNLPYVQDSMQDFWLASMGLPTSTQLNNQFTQQSFGFQNQKALQADEFTGRADLLEKEFDKRQKEMLFQKALNAGYKSVEEVPWGEMQNYIKEIQQLDLDQQKAQTDLIKAQAELGPNVSQGSVFAKPDAGGVNYNMAPFISETQPSIGVDANGNPTIVPGGSRFNPPRQFGVNAQGIMANSDGSYTDTRTGVTVPKLSVDKAPPTTGTPPPLGDLSGPKVSAKPTSSIPFGAPLKELGRDIATGQRSVIDFLAPYFDWYKGRTLPQMVPYLQGNPSRAMSAPAPSIRKLTPEELLQYSR